MRTVAPRSMKMWEPLVRLLIAAGDSGSHFQVPFSRRALWIAEIF